MKIFYYIQGNIRLFLYYSCGGKLKFLLPLHIQEQFEYRMNSINRKCYIEGQCEICKCSVPGLQMANKSCDRPCYPPFVSKKIWGMSKSYGILFDKKTNKLWFIDDSIKRFALIK